MVPVAWINLCRECVLHPDASAGLKFP